MEPENKAGLGDSVLVHVGVLDGYLESSLRVVDLGVHLPLQDKIFERTAV